MTESVDRVMSPDRDQQDGRAVFTIDKVEKNSQIVTRTTGPDSVETTLEFVGS